MSVTIKTGAGDNNKSSHIVGYESSRFRYECFKFTIPETYNDKPIISARLIGGKFSSTSNSCSETVSSTTKHHHTYCYGIAVKTSDTITADYNSKTKYGTVSFSETYPKLAPSGDPSCVLVPGDYYLYVYVEEAKYGYRAFKHEDGADLEFEYIQYTHCGAPTSITTSTVFAKPGGDFTISWSGAVEGNSNAISGYEVSYQIEDSAWTVHPFLVVGQTHTFTLPSDTVRGLALNAKVKTIGSVDGYDSEEFVVESLASVNSLPGAPSNLTVSREVVPSTGGTVTFSLKPGRDGDGQTTSLRYATQNDPSKSQDCGEDFTTDTITANTTYYFWTWDGVECSEGSVSKTIRVNTKPGLTLMATLQAEGKYLLQTIRSGGQNSGNIYTFGYDYGSEYSNTKTIVKNLTNSEYVVEDIRYWFSPLTEGANYTYKFWAQRHDGIELSEKVYLNNILSFTAPSYDKLVGLDLDGNEVTSIGQYYNSGVKVTLSSNFSGFINGQAVSNKVATIDLTAKERGKTIGSLSFSRERTSPTFSVLIPTEKDLMRIKEFVFNNIQYTGSTRNSPFKPYSAACFDLSLKRLGGEYGVYERMPLEIQYSIGSMPHQKHFTFEKESEFISEYSLSPEELWGEDGLLDGIINNSEIVIKEFQLIAYNIFGGSSISQTYSVFLDFREPTEVTDWSLSPGEGYPAFEGWEYIKESMPIYLSCTVKYYNSNPSLKLKNNYNQEEYSHETKVVNNTSPWVKINGAWVENPSEWVLTKQYTNLILPSFSQTTAVMFSLTTNSDANIQSTKNYKTELTAARHVDPIAHFTKLEYDESGILTGEYSIDDAGFDNRSNGTVLVFLADRTELINNGSPINSPFSVSHKFTNNYKEFAPMPVSTFYAKVKDGTTMAFETIKPVNQSLSSLAYKIVYSLQPTIAYRSHCVGINTKDPFKNGDKYLSDSAFTVSAINDNDQLYFVSSSNIGSIDLKNGGLKGFVVDAGSWSGVPGGVIPGESDTPAGLAPIAYSGEFSDLEQKWVTEIFLIAGGAFD